ncbi:MAG: nitrogenase iron-molybdenum cofactor biosynthesis protein NifN [Isosphaeraceae bacterium]|nr:nitrogenase iron-molybdenum cofactor biosynthesis protein NifN [Isosphaeraceae bacterium]
MATTTVLRRSKALSVSPLKASATIGASLAFMGLDRAMPLMHGAQGCTAFGKVFFVRHFREPIPLQTTAMDQISSVMGADENIVEALHAVCSKHKPSLIGLPTTGLAETQGADIRGAVRQFRERYPEFDGIAVVPVNTPDFSGCFESGFAAAVRELIEVLVPETRAKRPAIPRRRGRVNVLAGPALTVGDLETLEELIESFGLTPVIVPDLADSLDGHLTEDEFNPLTYGGATVAEIATLGDSDATLVVGRSLERAADLLQEKTGVPEYRFDYLLGLEAVDALVYCLHRISGREVPKKLERQRSQLQDAMVDTHFMIGQTRVAIAADPDLLLGFSQCLTQMGAEVVAAVAPAAGPALASVPVDRVQIGDLEDLEKAARERRAELLFGNSHAVDSAERLGLPIVRAGFPQYDLIGGYQRTFIGYRGTRQLLFDLANLLAEQRAHAIPPYRSIYSQKRDNLTPEGNLHGHIPVVAVDAP